ncbi:MULTISPECIES: type II toxin-antitoxin system RelB/DinJ family antitoxin [unclassified Treponema]|uniref:type II toxin-antitoxin system RelB/DinJ family antitoxin n=1 Tax=unclassified Treponema TaxID=2638727 RepID=UPI0020A4E5BF|nr:MULTISPECIES: type II toxin-antitoxin system RelB/DinJ family antitoxin [unclassified Treponema]UTC67230.1 type II toxin-antitoxin system RelB/DinJ family antitoxin [Treponema sp. OMZ 789]UTC69959.1 type II toxin-antitoxin system RelB/DinJ family antitoxin [Treponema sp. OMZ 790]UTC72673.1 type II toxin-antitoxin system RelB/DinJ family antitoxin [Treponema sp. OMZ 791]
MASTLVQIRVDEKLKDDVTAVYEQLGLDLSTAVRIFFKRSIAENGIPFSMKLENANQNDVKKQISPEILSAMQSMSQNAAINGVSEMSLDEINYEIEACRKGL